MFKKLLFTASLIMYGATVDASMTISGTRIIFPGSQKEVTVRTNNKGDLPSLVQVWADDGNINANLDNINVPFVITPPVYRVEPGKGQSVRLIYNGMALPQDRESVFWFNMLEIPPKSKSDSAQKLELAFRTRIKIFYRPQSLERSSSEAERQKLVWKVVVDPARGTAVSVTNPTPYYFSFDTANVVSGGKKIALQTDMLAPNQSRTFYPKIKINKGEKIQSLDYRLLNDYGAAVVVNLQLDAGQGFKIKE